MDRLRLRRGQIAIIARLNPTYRKTPANAGFSSDWNTRATGIFA